MTKSFSFCTFNIQAAIGTMALPHYLTRVHHQFLHTKKKRRTLEDIGEYLSRFDVVCLQEVDLGGRRANFECQVETLSRVSGLKSIASQENRRVRKISRHGNAVLSRFPILEEHDLKLPSRVPGRGAIVATLDLDTPISVISAHLSLGQDDQIEQFRFITSNIDSAVPTILAGDFNCEAISSPVSRFTENSNMSMLTLEGQNTYPSWRPRKGYDHISHSPHLQPVEHSVEDVRLSDHLPVSAIFRL